MVLLYDGMERAEQRAAEMSSQSCISFGFFLADAMAPKDSSAHATKGRQSKFSPIPFWRVRRMRTLTSLDTISNGKSIHHLRSYLPGGTCRESNGSRAFSKVQR